MNTPFTYFGNKTKVAPLIWLSDSATPTLSSIPSAARSAWCSMRTKHKLHRKRETIGDLDCLIAHFWRAIKNDPEGVAHYAFDPVSKINLQARHEWLMDQRATVHRNLRTSPRLVRRQDCGLVGMGAALVCRQALVQSQIQTH